ncbi:hypothetical protein DENSPDRAFT_149080 [Dentipellis sp. KUC8613]|nr:hypothetical protein DENSPDRAFT_149080 [Dentipellis sp. KUC8613]
MMRPSCVPLQRQAPSQTTVFGVTLGYRRAGHLYPTTLKISFDRTTLMNDSAVAFLCYYNPGVNLSSGAPRYGFCLERSRVPDKWSSDSWSVTQSNYISSRLLHRASVPFLDLEAAIPLVNNCSIPSFEQTTPEGVTKHLSVPFDRLDCPHDWSATARCAIFELYVCLNLIHSLFRCSADLWQTSLI